MGSSLCSCYILWLHRFVCACLLSMSLASAQLACLACLASSLVCALALAPDFRMCLSRRVPRACLSTHDSAVRVVLPFCLLYLSCLSPHVCIFVVGQVRCSVDVAPRWHVHTRAARHVETSGSVTATQGSCAQRCLCAYLCLCLRLSCRDALSSLLVSIWFVLASSESRPLRLCFRL